MPNYIDPITGEEDPSIDDVAVTVVLRWADRPDYGEGEFFAEITDRINELADTLGLEVEIHAEDMLSRDEGVRS